MLEYEALYGAAGVPIKMWTSGVPVEEAALAQLRNVASLPFVFHHVAVMPDVHWGMGATVGSVIATRGAVVPAAVGVDIGCFVGETRIPLLDGTQRTLADLAVRTEPFWVYSVGPDLNLVPGRAVCVKTRENAQLVRVTVSGGDEIVCTPDQEFMLPNGTYRRADKLKFNISLMPLYRKWQSRDGYEGSSLGKGTSRLTHVRIWESLNGAVPDGHVVHHVNHSHFNNAPDNLVLMTTSDHSSHHRKHGYSFDNADKRFQEIRLAGIARSKLDQCITEQRAKIGTENILAYMQGNPEHFSAAVADNGKRGAKYLDDFNRSPRKCDECGEVLPNPAACRWHKVREHAQVENHKVISVEVLNHTADVYCLQVAEHHNFALAAGVFVHNCGMMASRLDLSASDLPDNLSAVRLAIEAAVPHGRTDNCGVNDRGAWGAPGSTSPGSGIYSNSPFYPPGLSAIVEKHPKLERPSQRVLHHLGTLGTGNHFIEVCLDEHDAVWVMLHSGSRGIGNAIGRYFIERAKEHMRRWFVNLPDADLAYLPEHTTDFDDYVEAVGWAQDFALANRTLMMRSAVGAIGVALGRDIVATAEAIQCHHNYVERENHFGQNVLVTRKGAVRARVGDLGIVPGSMGARSYVVRGRGNLDSFQSCSHGAGRAMSRGEAKRRFTLADHAAATEGVECRKDLDVIDETPGAYKSIDAVMAAQESLVEVVHTLRQVICVKG